LPALKALRVAHPKANIEILGYPHIAAIANKRFYADAVRSIEYAALSRFFARGAELPSESRLFAGFDLILSYSTIRRHLRREFAEMRREKYFARAVENCSQVRGGTTVQPVQELE
jgi:hypothetical protein